MPSEASGHPTVPATHVIIIRLHQPTSHQPLHQLTTAKVRVVIFPHISHRPGTVAGKESIFHPDQPDIQTGPVQRIGYSQPLP
jgi:hypothetical protein